MTPLAMVRIGVWTASIAGLGALVRALTMTVVAVPVPEPATQPRSDTAPVRALGDLDSAALVVVSHDLFRRSRRPGPVAGVEPPGPSASVFPKPALRLVGIVVGADATAVIEGLPGARTARAVRQGDVIGPLTIGPITNAQVRVSGLDTTWVLTLTRKP